MENVGKSILACIIAHVYNEKHKIRKCKVLLGCNGMYV